MCLSVFGDSSLYLFLDLRGSGDGKNRLWSKKRLIMKAFPLSGLYAPPFHLYPNASVLVVEGKAEYKLRAWWDICHLGCSLKL